MIIALSLLASCTGGGTPPAGDGTGESGGAGGNQDEGGGDSGSDEGSDSSDATDKDAVYGKGLITHIITDTPEDSKVTSMSRRIKLLCGENIEVLTDSAASTKHEIVIGDTNRPISLRASTLLGELMDEHVPSDKNITDTIFYLIYPYRGSIAVVWSGEGAKETALEVFMQNYLKSSSLKLEDGEYEYVAYSKIEEMRKNEAKEREEAYALVEAEYGKGVVDALKAQFAVYDSDFYIWLANLYDPGEYDEEGNPKGGGFYYSNSARDNEGYYIDIESTCQAISFLAGSGMIRNGLTFKNAIPEKMQKEMLAFALSLQSPEDGYFYHPQWGKDITAARRSRDLGWAMSTITRFGTQPYWDTPNGHQGIYGAPSMNKAQGGLTSPLSSRSAATAAASIVTAVGYVDKYQPYMRSLTAWQSYLDGLVTELKTKSYSIGHNLAEQATQIKMRDKEAAEHGEPTGYVEAVTKFFNDNQNPTNGLWEETVSYNSINGLMKIMALYNNLNIELSYAEKAVASAAEVIVITGADCNGKQATGSVDVYNPWCAIDRVFTNVKTHGDATRVNNMRESLVENAEQMIRITTEKTKKFKKEDGSFGYTWNYSPAKSQDAPVAVPNTVEGDVNGGTIALTAITGNMLNALGISGLYIYAPSDFYIFIEHASARTHTEKKPPVLEKEEESKTLDFNSDTVGTIPKNITATVTDGSVAIVAGGKEGNGISLTTVPDKGDAFNFKAYQNTDGATCYSLEFDIKFSSINASTGTAIQIRMSNLYMLTLGVNTNGTFTVGDSSATNSSAVTTKFDGSFNAYEWHRIKIIQYHKDGMPEKTLVYVDGSLIGESTNYFGKESGKLGSGKGVVNFYALFSTNFSVVFDNISYDATMDTLS